MRDFAKEGTHTWERVLDYHRCSSCGKIVENRKRYELVQGKWRVELTCSRCNKHFWAIQERKPTFGPLMGG